MPVLLIFLVAALTMRSWSEERRAGTLESLLTSSASPFQLVELAPGVTAEEVAAKTSAHYVS